MPTVVTTREEVLASTGSLCSYAATPLAMAEVEQGGLKQFALVGMSCLASINGSLPARGVNKYQRRIELTLGLLRSKTFTHDGQQQVLAEHGVDIGDVIEINIKGVFQVWTRDGGYHEIPLKLFHAHTRPGCQLCPDFNAEHADISCGGIGADSNWTIAIVRTKRGKDWMRGVVDAGLVEVRPGESDPVAMGLSLKLSEISRKRWSADWLPEDHRAPAMLLLVP